MNRTFSGPRINRRQALTLAALAAGSLTTSRVVAQDATPQADSSTPPGPMPEVLLTGLLSPRFMAMHNGSLYFTESGNGGDEPIFLIPGEGTPAPETPISTTGKSGKLSRLEADGSVSVIVDDFKSYTFGEMGEIVGPAGITFDDAGAAYVAVGAPGPFIAMMPLTGEEGVVYKVDVNTGEKSVIANLIDHELQENPDPVAIDSNLYGLAYLDGTLYVADAGANAIISVDAATGDVATFAVTGGLPAPFMVNGNPMRLNAQEIDSVPSTVVVGPDGQLYVSFVTGGPFPEGFAPVWRYSTDGTKQVYAEGLTMVGDLAFGPDGLLYASVISTNLIQQQPGQIVRIHGDGRLEVVVPALPLPNGIEFDAEGNLYVLTKITGFPEGGELWRIPGIAVAASDSTPVPQATPITGGHAEPRTITFVDTAFEPSALTIPANTDITVNFVNQGFLAHDFHIADPKISSGVLLNNEVSTVVLNLPAGEYTYFCTQIGHRAQGMEGKLTVK